MPSNILTADTSFPQLTDEQSPGEKITLLTNYLYMLLEQLRYTLNNLGEDNFNETEFQNIANIITEPVYIQLESAEGDIAELQVTATSLTSRISDAEGNISTLTQTSNSLTSRISSAEGNISTLQQTATSLTSRISDAEGNISTLTQTVNGMTLSVSNGSSGSTIRLLANGVEISSQRITFSGMVTYTDLATSGWTTINGDNITTGTITAIDITSCNIESSTIDCVLKADGTIGGELRMCYINSNYVAGGIRVDDQGAGTAYERKYRMFIYTDTILGVPFCMKIFSANGMSITSDEIIIMESATHTIINGNDYIRMSADSIYLNGDVYINGTALSDLLSSGTTE